jgi:hypothetical protein
VRGGEKSTAQREVRETKLQRSLQQDQQKQKKTGCSLEKFMNPMLTSVDVPNMQLMHQIQKLMNHMLACVPLGCLWKFNSRVLPLFTGLNHWAKELNLVQILLLACRPILECDPRCGLRRALFEDSWLFSSALSCSLCLSFDLGESFLLV